MMPAITYCGCIMRKLLQIKRPNRIYCLSVLFENMPASIDSGCPSVPHAAVYKGDEVTINSIFCFLTEGN